MTEKLLSLVASAWRDEFYGHVLRWSPLHWSIREGCGSGWCIVHCVLSHCDDQHHLDSVKISGRMCNRTSERNQGSQTVYTRISWMSPKEMNWNINVLNKLMIKFSFLSCPCELWITRLLFGFTSSQALVLSGWGPCTGTHKGYLTCLKRPTWKTIFTQNHLEATLGISSIIALVVAKNPFCPKEQFLLVNHWKVLHLEMVLYESFHFIKNS